MSAEYSVTNEIPRPRHTQQGSGVTAGEGSDDESQGLGKALMKLPPGLTRPLHS